MKLLSRIAEQLENAAVDELDADIDRCLQLLGLELELTIASLVERDGDRLVTRYQWRAKGYMDPPFELPLESADWWQHHLEEDEDVVIDDVAELPDSAGFERDYLSERSTASLVAIAAGWRTDQFLIAEVLWNPRTWSDSDLELLSGSARHLGTALVRQQEKRRLVDDAARAEAESEAKDAFIATLAHELRTPLTAILGYAQLLASEVIGGLSIKQKQFVNDILSCAEHLDRIVNESLDLAKLDSNRMPLKLEELDARSVVQSAASTIEPRLHGTPVELRLDLPDGPVPLTADAVKLGQVLINLLSNALKFTEKGSITVTVRPLQDEVMISVRDTGLGIASGNLERIFESFSRVHRSRDQEGTGLGLALVKKLVELHEGRISVESETDVGTCFTIHLPQRPLGVDAGRSAYVRSVV